MDIIKSAFACYKFVTKQYANHYQEPSQLNGKWPIQYLLINEIIKQNVLLLPIFGKIFERLICNERYSSFSENGLISPNKSGFKQGDSCIIYVVFFNKQLQFLGLTFRLFSKFTFSRLKVAYKLLSNLQNFNFKKFVLNTGSLQLAYIFRIQKNTFYWNRFKFSFEIYL